MNHPLQALAVLLAAGACASILAAPGSVPFPAPAPVVSHEPFPTWIHGANCATEPKIQVFRYDADTYILRQSMCTDFEGNFVYLLFGRDKVLLEDTGAVANPPIPMQQTVMRIVDTWLSERGRTTIPLVVAHSHAHGDHVAGDGQFLGQPGTTVVGTSVASVQSHFGIANWPTDIVSYDLGGRILDVIPIPGHEASHIAFCDRNTRLLLTGDTLYAGRLYIQDFPAYMRSVQRLVDFTATNDVSYVLGTHIEMKAEAGQQFPYGSTYHPNEHVLQLRRGHLVELLDGILAMQDAPHVEVHDDFIIFPF